jgi:predicted site-specific integrase-resolvase
MKEFTIEQVIKILGITRPTAYNLARKIGRLDEGITPNGKYFIPTDAVYDVIRKELQEVRSKESRYDAAIYELRQSTNGGGS